MTDAHLIRAAEACRAAAQAATAEADRVDVLMHRCPDAGCGMRVDADALRARALNLRIADEFLSRWATRPDALTLLAALERGGTVRIIEAVTEPVVPQQPLSARVVALFGHDPVRGIATTEARL